MDAPKVRYSDEELEEFRTLINEKLDKARNEYEELRRAIVVNDGNGDGDTSRKFDSLEDSQTVVLRSEAEHLAERQKQFIQKLEAALNRIDNKTYGICRVTGKLIPKERLRVVPHTTLSVEAKK